MPPNWGIGTMRGGERNLEDKAASKNSQTHSTGQSESGVENGQSGQPALGWQRQGGGPRLLAVARGDPSPVPQPGASAQPLRLLHGRPWHWAASGPALPGWHRLPGGPLLRSAQRPPWPHRRWQGQERSLPRRARWPSRPQGPPAQLPQPAPGTAGTEEGPPSPSPDPPPSLRLLPSSRPGTCETGTGGSSEDPPAVSLGGLAGGAPGGS